MVSLRLIYQVGLRFSLTGSGLEKLALESMPLRLLRRGDAAEIDQVIGQPEQVHRLQELGLRAGVAVEMVQPGSTCIVRIQNQKLCVRDADLFSVLVRLRGTT